MSDDFKGTVSRKIEWVFYSGLGRASSNLNFWQIKKSFCVSGEGAAKKE
jgi:hypothetical protein